MLSIDEASCRICGEAGTSEDPLFHPCKCMGSIRFIHEPCLLKWLTAKSGGRLDELTDMTGSVTGETKCELCGFPFQFTPEYSNEYLARLGVLFSVGLALDISSSVSVQAWRRVLPILRLIAWLFLFPILVGFVGLLSLAKFARGDSEIYQYGVSDVSHSVFRVYFTGSLMSMLGSVILDRVKARLALRRDRRERSLRTMVATALIGLPAGLVGISGPYFVGRSFVHLCNHDGVFCESLLSPAVVETPLTDFNSDASFFTIGFVVVTFTVFTCNLVYRAFDTGISRLWISIWTFFRQLIVRSSFLVVPLLIGKLILSLSILPDAAHLFLVRQSGASQTILTVLIGCCITVPSVLTQRLIYGKIFSEIELSYLARVALYGRLPTDSRLSYTVTVVRTFIQIAVLLIGVVPAIQSLWFLRVLPLRYAPSSSSPLVLPFELFYAHILIPLLLNAPPVPSGLARLVQTLLQWISSRTNSVGIREIFVGLFLTCAIIFSAIVLVITIPVGIGRLLVSSSESRDDLLATSVGFLVVLISLHIVSRGRVLLRGHSRIRMLQILSAVFTAFVLVFILPVIVGGSFHVALIVPLRHISSIPIHKAVVGEETSWMDFVPLWIMGVMLLKIKIALASTSLVRHWRVLLDQVRRMQEIYGIFSTIFHKYLLLNIFFPIVRISILFFVLPFTIGRLVLKFPDFGVLTFLAGYGVIVHGLPWLRSFLKRQKELALARRNLLRTKLRNVD